MMIMMLDHDTDSVKNDDYYDHQKESAFGNDA